MIDQLKRDLEKRARGAEENNVADYVRDLVQKDLQDNTILAEKQVSEVVLVSFPEAMFPRLEGRAQQLRCNGLPEYIRMLIRTDLILSKNIKPTILPDKSLRWAISIIDMNDAKERKKAKREAYRARRLKVEGAVDVDPPDFSGE